MQTAGRLRVDDLEPAPDGTELILIRASKVAQEQEGCEALLAASTMRRPAALADASSIRTGVLFRSISNAGSITTPWSLASSPASSRRMAAAAGCPDTLVSRMSSHSARDGISRDMA